MFSLAVQTHFYCKGLRQSMKSTLMFRTIANPRRTTLAGAGDRDVPRVQEREHATDLPARTANPRRTVLQTLPESVARAAEDEQK
jgi:hypothetical protein